MSDELERLRAVNAQLANQIVGMSDRLQASVREIQAKTLRDAADYAVANVGMWDGRSTLVDLRSDEVFPDTAAWLRSRADEIEQAS